VTELLLLIICLLYFYHYYYQVKEDEMGRECSTNWEKRNAYRILLGKSEGKRALGRPRRRWVDNIKTDLREIGWTGSIWLRIGTSGGLL
jgi:hypothetical protein